MVKFSKLTKKINLTRENDVGNLLANAHLQHTIQDTRKRIRQKKQRNRAKKGIIIHTQTKQQGHVTLSTELQSTALTLNFLAASMA